MEKNRGMQITPRYPCCIYEITDPEKLYRNLKLERIKSYGDSVELEDGTVLYRMEYDETLFSESNERTLCRCRKCSALFLMDYHYESDMYDPWSSSTLTPVASEEEADLLNLLMDGKKTGLPDFRRIHRYDWKYSWIGTEDPRPLDTEELKRMIREKYADQDQTLLENLIAKAGQDRMVEKMPLTEPEPETKEDEEIKIYRYMANRDYEVPVLIRLGSFEKMEADRYAYPGVWKDTPSLNDIRVGLGSYMDYDDITANEAEKIRLELQERYDRMAEEKEE